MYSLDGSSGKIDGYEYRPLKDVTEVYYTTKAGKTYRNGIIYGYNCRHYLIPYNKGNKPIEVPADIVEQQRKINNTQRAMERRVRELRELAATTPIKEDRIKARKEAVKSYKEYKDYCRDYNVAYYPSRVQVWSEQTENQTAERLSFLNRKYFRR